MVWQGEPETNAKYSFDELLKIVSVIVAAVFVAVPLFRTVIVAWASSAILC